ncbi:hypothetical protein Q9Q99_19855 [Curtobacterium flaccumfaciens]|nr:hypothetical protein Q9Q99_19855 [Curtobacterium flaccumfaciens]
MTSLVPHIGDATVLVLGNVWDEPLAAVAPLAAERVLFRFPGAGGGFDADGVLHGAVLRSVRLGTTGTAPDRRELVRSVFQQAGFTVQDEDDIRGWLWLHVVLDAGMFAQALNSGGLATMVGDRQALREAFRIGRELLPVLEARGVDLSRHRSTTLPVRLPATSATLVAAAGTALVPIARASLAAHDDPTAADPWRSSGTSGGPPPPWASRPRASTGRRDAPDDGCGRWTRPATDWRHGASWHRASSPARRAFWTRPLRCPRVRAAPQSGEPSFTA